MKARPLLRVSRLMPSSQALALAAIGAAGVLAAASPASACHIPTTATFVFAAVPDGVPESVTVLDVEFPDPLPVVGVPRPGWPLHATARIRKVIRGAAPKRKTIEVQIPGLTCTELANQPRAGLVAGAFAPPGSGKSVFAPYWMPRNVKPGSEVSLQAPSLWLQPPLPQKTRR